MGNQAICKKWGKRRLRSHPSEIKIPIVQGGFSARQTIVGALVGAPLQVLNLASRRGVLKNRLSEIYRGSLFAQ
jgi:hypothetical protein